MKNPAWTTHGKFVYQPDEERNFRAILDGQSNNAVSLEIILAIGEALEKHLRYNDQFTGQAILSTVCNVEQPLSKKFTTVGILPAVTQEFYYELQSKKENRQPSCSLAEALIKQDLFINSTLANLGCSILWNMLREGMIRHRGFFLNIKTLQCQGVPIN